MASISAAVQDPMSASYEQLVEAIKNMQRQDPVAKGQWAAYVNSNGSMMRDPSKHPGDFLQAFLVQFNSGVRLPENDEGAASIAELIKLGLRRSPHWQSTWTQYCLHYTSGRDDPSKHDASSLFRFLDFIAEFATHAVGATYGVSGQQQQQQQLFVPDAFGPAGMGMNFGGMKRPRDGGFGAPNQGGAADAEKETLAMQVKQMQRSGEGKEAWSVFCDLHLGGMKDPGRHDAATLAHFLRSQGIAPMSPSTGPAGQAPADATGGSSWPPNKRLRSDSFGGGYGLPPAADPVKEKLVGQVKAFQRLGDTQKQQWASWCETHFDGIRDPNRHNTEALQSFVTAHNLPDSLSGAAPNALGQDPVKDQLVAQVKGFQRQGDQEKEVWATYCETYLAGVKDPSRHDVGVLQDFVTTHVQPQAAMSSFGWPCDGSGA